MASNPIKHKNIKVNLKTYNNILRKNIRAAKVHFYHSQFDELKNNSSKTWSAINNLLNRNNTKSSLPDYYIIDNNDTITDPLDIANRFNDFFTNVGPNLANEIIFAGQKKYSDYIGLPFDKNFKFQEIDETYIKHVISTLPNKSSCGYDNLCTIKAPTRWHCVTLQLQDFVQSLK